jgi:hypothetical protein
MQQKVSGPTPHTFDEFSPDCVKLASLRLGRDLTEGGSSLVIRN